MKQIDSPNYNSELSKIDSGYPMGYGGIYADGYLGAADQHSEKAMLRQFVSTIRKHWLMILGLTALVTGATIVYVAQKPDYYKSVVRVQVNAENNPAAGGRSGGSIIVTSSGADPAYFSTQLQILEGSGLLRRVVKTLDLQNNPNFLDPQKGKRLTVLQNVQRMFGLYRPPATDPNAIASSNQEKNNLELADIDSSDLSAETEKLAPYVSMIRSNLTVSPVKDSRTSNKETRLIDVEFTHQNADLAAKVANAIGDVYVLQNLEQKVLSNASAGDFLQKRVAELQSQIRQGEEQLNNYAKANQIVSLDANQNTVVQKFSGLSSQVAQAEIDRIKAQTEYQAALQNQMRSEGKDSQAVQLEAKLNDLRQKLDQLKTEYTDEWFEVIQTKKQIESVEKQLTSSRKRASDVQIATLQEKLNETVARERELQSNFEKQRGEVMRQNEASINYKIIQQEISTNRTLLDSLLQKSRENDVILNGTPNNVLVSDRAIVPRSPIGPERSKNIVLAFVVSLAAGCGLAFLMNWLDDSIHNSDEIENMLGLPLLAAIPAAPMSLTKRLLPKSLALRRRNKRRNNNYDLTVFERPEFAEAYLQLRTHLMLSRAGGPPQSILVTSGEENEGKTVTALNLATSLAETGNKVLLIDGDLRCPRLNLIKELDNTFGLTALLTTDNISEEVIDRAIQKDRFSPLHILTTGERSINPTNLLCSEEMRTLLMRLSAKYTHIVIDSPPVLYFADSTILSTLVDSVIIVVRDNSSSTQSVLKAHKMLRGVGAKNIGIVMNGIQRQWANYSKYRYYEMNGDMSEDKEFQALKLN